MSNNTELRKTVLPGIMIYPVVAELLLFIILVLNHFHAVIGLPARCRIFCGCDAAQK